jgi:hypothetical protein
MAEQGLIAQALERSIVGAMSPPRILVWLDGPGAYTAFVDGLVARHGAGDFAVPVVAFRGSFLEAMLALEPYEGGTEPGALLLHVPGFDEVSIRKTPLLELFEVGTSFRKPIDALVREAASRRVAPDVLEAYLAQGEGSLDAAEAWLAGQLSGSRGGFEVDLEKFGVEWVLRELVESESSRPREGADGYFVRETHAPEGVATLGAYLHRQTGMDDAWLAFFGAERAARPLSNLAAAFFGWLLCVEYVQDLNRAPSLEGLKPLRTLAPPLVAVCASLVRALREKHADLYQQLADEVEQQIKPEFDRMTPEDLGQIDTFREEESRVLQGAVAAARAGAWSKVRAWAEARAGEVSFWLQRDMARRLAWVLVAEAARFGEALARHPSPLAAARDVNHALELYQREAYEVDLAHRRFEQKRLKLLEPRLPHFVDFQEIGGELRRQYRAWADALARDFARLCEIHGHLPDSSLQQRTLYEQVVQPLTTGPDKVAYFLVDALRFEMATELAEELKGNSATSESSLRARLAELPTLTSMGMNALAPVAREGRLAVVGAFEGLRAGEYTVRTPADRARAIGTRSQSKDALLLRLAEVCELEARALAAKLRDARIVVIHSREIDDAGEANLGLATFEITLGQIKAAWHHLQAAGVKQFVFTADHGFLLQDETTRAVSFGKLGEASRRHALVAEPRSDADTTSVPLAQLGYDGVTGHLALRRDTAVFATGNTGATFVHGGNSLQERVIPVLTVSRRQAEAASLTAYKVEAKALPDDNGSRRLALRVLIAPSPQGSLAFIAASRVTVAIRVPHRADVLVTLKDASPGGVLRGGSLQVPVGEAWTEVFFSLQGPQDEQVRVEVYHPDSIERVHPASPSVWFDVDGRQMVSESPPPPPVSAWQDAFADQGVRAVFLHLEKFGAISEAEATKMLGSPFAFRKFSRELDEHMRNVPFRVVAKPGAEGKRYEKDKDG